MKWELWCSFMKRAKSLRHSCIGNTILLSDDSWEKFLLTVTHDLVISCLSNTKAALEKHLEATSVSECSGLDCDGISHCSGNCSGCQTTLDAIQLSPSRPYMVLVICASISSIYLPIWANWIAPTPSISPFYMRVPPDVTSEVGIFNCTPTLEFLPYRDLVCSIPSGFQEST